MTKSLQYEVYCYSCHCARCTWRDIYVGKAKYGTNDRHHTHVVVARRILSGRGTKKDLKFDYFMAKHGIDNLHVRTLITCSSEDEMNDQEIKMIVEKKTFHEFGGMNFDRGGRGGRRKGVYTPTPETRVNASIAQKKAHEADPTLRYRATRGLIEGGKVWREANPDAMKGVVERGWETIHKQLETDPEYAEQFTAMHMEKSRKGGDAFLVKHANPEFADDFAKKCGDGVSAWCKANPESVKLRAQRAAGTKAANGTGIKAARATAQKTPKSEYTRRGLKGWELRRQRQFRQKSHSWLTREKAE